MRHTTVRPVIRLSSNAVKILSFEEGVDEHGLVLEISEEDLDLKLQHEIYVEAAQNVRANDRQMLWSD